MYLYDLLTSVGHKASIKVFLEGELIYDGDEKKILQRKDINFNNIVRSVRAVGSDEYEVNLLKSK